MDKIKILFEPIEKVVYADPGENLLQLALKNNIIINNPCNGKGICGKCRVKIKSRHILPPTDNERKFIPETLLDNGVRLACGIRISGELEVDISNSYEKQEDIQVLETGMKVDIGINPSITKAYTELPRPKLDDNRTLLKRFSDTVGYDIDKNFNLDIIRNLPEAVEEEYKLTAILYNNHIIGVETGDTSGKIYGVAVDIGTTTVVVSILDINTGKEIGTAAAANSQRIYGQDVISRIQYVENEENLFQLQELIVNQINNLILQAAEKSGISPKKIYEVVVAANSTMLHLFLGVKPQSIAVSPYTSVFRKGFEVKASSLKLNKISDFGIVYIMPSVSSYVGADIVSGVIATKISESKTPSLLVDIGTNGEIVFGSKDGMVACSCAAGPALEGMNISCGSIAIDGAVEKIKIEKGSIDLKVIGDTYPKSICGSGIIDVISQFIKNSIIELNGRFSRKISEEYKSSLKANGEKRFSLIKDDSVYITQKDIRQVQLAKGAILSAIHVLFKEINIGYEKVDKVYIAGAFGKHLSLKSIIQIGLMPVEFAEKVVFVGNTSKMGAVKCLLNKEYKAKAELVLDKTKYFELSVYKGYDRLFMEDMAFPAPLKEEI
ncbi:ASKHA domain-containing protein [Clostridium sp. JNZ X4-2]